MQRKVDLLDITNIVLRVRQGKVYFFNEQGIYQAVPCEEAVMVLTDASHCPLPNRRLENGKFVFEYNYCPDVIHIVRQNYNSNLMQKAITALEVGDSMQRFTELLNTVTFDYKELPKGLDRFVTKIDTPIFERERDNCNVKTIDFIRVNVYICRNWDNRSAYIKENLPAIKEMVIKKIRNTKKFQNYGIPINVFQISNITLKQDDSLTFVFELKKELRLEDN